MCLSAVYIHTKVNISLSVLSRFTEFPGFQPLAISDLELHNRSVFNYELLYKIYKIYKIYKQIKLVRTHMNWYDLNHRYIQLKYDLIWNASEVQNYYQYTSQRLFMQMSTIIRNADLMINKTNLE